MIPFSKAELAGLQLDARKRFNDSSLRVQQFGWAAVANVRGELVAYDDEGDDWYVMSFFGDPVTNIGDVQTRQQAARSGQAATTVRYEPHKLASWRPFHSDSGLLERVLATLISVVVALYVVRIINIIVADASMQPVMRVTIIISALIAAYAILLYLLPLKIKRKN